MKNIIFSESINENIRLDNARRKHKTIKTRCKTILKPFRVYTIDNKKYTAKGYWIDNGKLYRDKITFSYYTNYTQAKKRARELLKNTSEICISIENIKKNILYIIYRDKIQILRIKYTYKILHKRQALQYIKNLSEKNGEATLEYIQGKYKITSYK